MHPYLEYIKNGLKLYILIDNKNSIFFNLRIIFSCLLWIFFVNYEIII